MSIRFGAIAAAALSLATVFSAGSASSADLPYKVKAKPIVDVPFFFVIDDRITYSYIFSATDPGQHTLNANGLWNGKTEKQVYSFTHFDAWAYGTNFFTISMFKSGHNDPASPCTQPGGISSSFTTAVTPANCAGATEIYGLFRSAFGWNELFNTKMFSIGPLHNISFEVGMDANSENDYNAAAKRDFVAGLQFAFDLPYKGYLNVSPLAYKEINHSGYEQCGSGFPASFGPSIPNVTCLVDGNTDYKTTWAIETGYYMPLGFIPEAYAFFDISGRAAWYGRKGNENSPLYTGGGGGAGSSTKIETNAEPIRLTFDASKAAWGGKYSHFVDVWVAYRYWQNKFGLDATTSALCVSNGISNGTCNEKSLYAGVTVKF